MAGNGQVHVLTLEDGRKGSRQSKLNRRAELRLRKREIDAHIEAARLELLKTALAQPVVSGTIVYLVISLIEGARTTIATSTPGAPGSSSSPNAIQKLLAGLGIVLNVGANPIAGSGQLVAGLIGTPGSSEGQIGSLIKAITNSGIQLDFLALKAVILIYIASGGNLAGILQSQGFGSLISSLGITKAAAP